MTQTPLYKYKGKNGELITTIDLGIEHEKMLRLVADVGNYLTDGKITTTAIDILPKDISLWTEHEFTDDIDTLIVEPNSNNKEAEPHG